MPYRRDFTIGLREAAGLYRMLALEKWRKGTLGFGLVGALAAWMYMTRLTLTPAARVLTAAGTALAVMAFFTLALILRVQWEVRSQARRSGRESYVQETEIDGFGVRVTVGKDRARLAFEKLTRVKETRRAFYLFLSGAQAWILPKAQMENPAAECQELRRIFQSVMERSRLQLKK